MTEEDDIAEEQELETLYADVEFEKGEITGNGTNQNETEEDSEVKTEQPSAKKDDFTIEQKQELLLILGFTKHDNAEKGIKFVKMIDSCVVGKTFKIDKKSHQWWAYRKDSDPTDKNRFLATDVISKMAIVKLYMEITNHMLPVPAQTLIGHIKELHGKQIAVKIENPESFEKSETLYGKGAIKTDDKGHYLPAGFSKDKLVLPRDIRLPDCEAELKAVPQTKQEGAKEHKNDFTERVGKQEQHNEADIVTSTMREAVRAAVDITLKEVVEKDVPVQGLGGFVLEIGKVIFDAKMAEVAK